VLIISGAHAAQSQTASLQTLVDATSTITATLTTTPTVAHTATPVVTLTATLTPTPAPNPSEVVIEEPDLHPAYAGMCDSYWYSYTNNRGFDAYLTLNVNDPLYSTNWAEWHPTITQSGYYRVEAFIPSHSPLLWDCPPNHPRIISYDTSDARYTIQHANGQTLFTGTQKSISNNWLPIGEYLFRAGSEGYVTLTDLNGEEKLTTTVSFSALRFTWQRSPPASVYLPLTSKVASPVLTSTVSIQNAPAFDRCHLPNISQMQTWWNSSPYRITNVYIGGGLLFHECTVPDTDWIETVQDQGWGMIPTWIGPQAPCSSYKLRMSSDPAIAYQQGQTEADAASLAAWQIGLSGYGMGGTIIYYDMEDYNPANTGCREAVKSFISGWTERLHYWGNRSGAYGGGCTSYVRDWAEATYPPDNLWVAAWNYNHYRKNVSLFGITCVPDILWPNHQRIRQYTGGHNETWGNVTFTIDSNISDAEIVTRTQGITSLFSSISLSSNTMEILDYSNLPDSPDQSWLIADGILYSSTVEGQNWQPIENMRSGMAMRKVFFIDKWQGWLIANTNEGNYLLFSTSDGGNSWPEITPLPVDPGWSLHSIQFSDILNGWIVLKELTHSNFSNGRLLHTTDGGKSWQTLDLPIGETVRFITKEIGWIAGGVGGKELYQTQDGGRTWRSVILPLLKGTINAIMLPAFMDPQNGILPVMIVEPDETQLEVFTTYDGGETWQWSYTVASLPEGLSAVSFTTLQAGWGVSNIGSCLITDNGKDCILQTKLWHTQDGGKTWEVIETP
jgi:photosystem II stability/assembly factor-like uncharacterized protein